MKHSTLRHIVSAVVVMSIAFAGVASVRLPIVKDTSTGNPLPRVSVFDSKGRMIGVADENGRLPEKSVRSLPITLRSLGYKDKTIYTLSDSVINMDYALYDLPEVSVNTGKRPILHMIGFVREISTMFGYADTITLYREKWVDFMVPMGSEKRYKGWTSPRVLKSRSYYKFTNSAGLDSVSDRSDHHFSWSDWMSLPKRLNLPESIAGKRDGRDSLMGPISPIILWNRTGDHVSTNIDVLADTVADRWMPRIGSLFSHDTDFHRLLLNYDYSEVDTFAVKPQNLERMSIYVESEGRGHSMFRFNRKEEPFFVTTYADIHIIDRENIKVSKAKEMENDPSKALDPMIIPRASGLNKHDDAIEDLIARVNSIDHDSRRLAMQIDRRVGNMNMPRPPAYSRKQRAVNAMKSILGL